MLIISIIATTVMVSYFFFISDRYLARYSTAGIIMWICAALALLRTAIKGN